MARTDISVNVYVDPDTRIATHDLTEGRDPRFVTVDIGEGCNRASIFLDDVCDCDRLIEAATEARTMLARVAADQDNLALFG